MGAPQYEQAGADIGGTGTTNTIPRWTGPSTLGDSGLTDDGSVITSSRRFDVTNLSGIRVGTGADYLRLSQSGTTSFIDALSTNGTLRFRVNAGGTDAIFASAAGSVGIGTTSPLAKLHALINGTAVVSTGSDPAPGTLFEGTNAALTTGATSTQQLAIMSNSAVAADAGGGLVLGGKYTGNAYANFAAIKSGKDNATGAEYGGYLAFYTRTNGQAGVGERARIDSAGNFILNTATTGATIQAAGSQQGLKLPATPGNADTQTLDCYQENTWTPTLTGFGGTVPTVDTARFTRVGRLVYFAIRLSATGGANYSGTRTTTYISLPVAPGYAQANALMADNNVNSLGQGLIATNFGGVVFLPTFALTVTGACISGVYEV